MLAAVTAALGVAVAYAGSIPLVGHALLGPLEQRYPPLTATLWQTRWSCSAAAIRRGRDFRRRRARYRGS